MAIEVSPGHSSLKSGEAGSLDQLPLHLNISVVIHEFTELPFHSKINTLIAK